MKKIAIIGSGISGLGCVHFLSKDHEVTLYEKESYIGGHTNTIDIHDEPVSFDTGFMVFNHHTYPNLTRLFKELDVETYPTSMSFSVQHLPSSLEYCGSGWNGLFGQRRNISKPSFWKMLSHINRFNVEGRSYLQKGSDEITVNDFCKELKLNPDFLHKYLVPMSSAVWSTPPDQMLDFPALTLLRFFDNHGFLGMNTQHQWYTVKDGSRSYVKKLLDRSSAKVLLNAAVTKVYRNEGNVIVEDSKGDKHSFDDVVLATHADHSVRIVDDLSTEERNILAAFSYQKNIATIHSDNKLMPERKRIWSSWNYRINKDNSGSTIYWMNSLQKLNINTNYYVSIDDKGCIDKHKKIKEIEYEHPLFSVQAIKAQKNLSSLNRDGIHFCGAYHGYGFHEDGLNSAIQVSKEFNIDPWKN
jgi:uncharacterized protein